MGFQASTSAPTPLAQLQNFQGPVKSTQSKIGAVVPTPSEPSSQLLKKAAKGKCVAYSLDYPDRYANVFLDDGMDVDTEFTPHSAIQLQGSTGPSFYYQVWG
ncbi:hypothetical protein BU17DRAFT_95165 [Hysterangium stoloniferum]|nr:hypothetical protein BU17DRAFT_95165 [Hysterangium stoloniferum]